MNIARKSGIHTLDDATDEDENEYVDIQRPFRSGELGYSLLEFNFGCFKFDE